MTALAYETLETIPVRRPVDRVRFIADRCRGMNVLDIGCLDETAIDKQQTQDWLHRRIAEQALSVLGIDQSASLPPEGLVTAPNARIIKGDGLDPPDGGCATDIIVAGEFIEHIENPLAFLRQIKERFPERELLISTPNGASFANGLLGLIGREAQHPDHLLTSTYKTLNTLCRRAGAREWQIIPYRFYATEMLLESRGAKAVLVRVIEKVIRVLEWLFPLRSFGYLVQIKL